LRSTRADTIRVLFRSFAWIVSDFVFGFLYILFVYLEACLGFPWVVGLGFLCILETLCVLVLVYLRALCAFFLVYNTSTYQKKKKKELAWHFLLLACLFIFDYFIYKYFCLV
jgi:hypothetical protein